MSNVIQFPCAEERADVRFNLISQDAPDINSLPLTMGTPDDWFASAMQHVVYRLPSGHSAGTVTVSAAAARLLVMKLEELLYDGPKLSLPIAD